MKFISITALTFAAMAYAAPAEPEFLHRVDIHLPAGCKKTDLISKFISRLESNLSIYPNC